MLNINTTVKLNNGVEMPVMGYGTFKISSEEAKESVLSALEVGYRHIDTASYYKNEKGIGEAVKESGIKREEIFVATKVWLEDLGYDKTMKAFELSMKEFGLDYLDLYLIHWPRPWSNDSWKAMVELYEAKRIRAIGVCNHDIVHLESLIASSNVIPAVNQVESHPELQQREVLKYCTEKGIVMEAWSPIMKGKVMEMPLLIEIAQKYGKSPAQVTLRWHLQRGVAVIPKSSSKERMKQNLDIYDFELTEQEMNSIATLEAGTRLGFSPEFIYENGFDPNKNYKK